MADGKWITDLTADTPLSEAARVALRVRLQVVHDYLLRADEAQSDPEVVHQLRVSTRRAGAALRIFGGLLPETSAKSAKRRLRRLRRDAGLARDWDVFLLDALARRQQTTAARLAGFNYLIGYGVAIGAAIKTDLMVAWHKEGERFETFIAETLDAVETKDKHPGTLWTLVQPLIAQLQEELEAKAVGDLNDAGQLHQVRIAGKHLRYAMELFAACFDKTFKETLYPQIEEMQEILGRANDSFAATCRLEALRTQGQATLGSAWKDLQPGVADLLAFHRRRLPRERRAFLKWWEQWRTNGGPMLRALLGSK